MTKILVVDYGMSNLASIRRALEICGADAYVSTDPKDCKEADKIVLPGVGSFDEGMRNLHQMGWFEALRAAAERRTQSILGICLGMQLLAAEGTEGHPTEGLGLIPGKIIKLVPVSPIDRIPHVGWNNLHIVKKDPILAGIPEETDFYFVHSYHFCPEEKDVILGTTPHCGSFVSMVKLGNVYGTQFHPEKSSKYGLKLLTNFINL